MKALIIAIAKLLAPMLLALCANSTVAQGLTPGSYHWYVPEHERYGSTEFYSMPNFQSARVRITHAQRFKLLGGSKGWAQIEFDIAGKAYVHLRMLRNVYYDPTATDLWHEFQRASVFAEEPAKIEARLKPPPAATPTPAVTDSKTPAWKRYKDSWGIKTGRPAPAGSEEGASDPAQPPTRPVTSNPTTKPRTKYPLLTPLGSEPPQEAAPSDANGRDAESSPPR